VRRGEEASEVLRERGIVGSAQLIESREFVMLVSRAVHGKSPIIG